MDTPEAEPVDNVDSVIIYFLYGFFVLLGISIFISLGKVIYHFYKVHRDRNVESTDDTTDTECHSISNETSVTDRPSDTNASDSDRLRIQLDKLRRLLNRLNAMGTFSRDTIGDLSHSVARVNNSKAASSDMSEFWSEIDFDEFDDSTITDGKFGKTPTEKSVSPSVSDFSLDTSSILFDNARHKNFATSSRENVLNVSSALNRPTNPSDAIIQILTILDSIMLKNRNCDRPLKNNTLKVDLPSESTDFKTLPKEIYPSELSISTQKLRLSPSVPTMKIDSMRKSPISDTVITIPEYRSMKELNTDLKIANNVLSSQSSLLERLSQSIEPQCIPSAASIEAKISKFMSVVNITSSSGPRKFYSTKLSSSSKSLNNKKISMSQSVSLCVDSLECLSTHAKEVSKSLSVTPGNENCDDMLPNTSIAEISQSELNVEAINRSRSLSDLLDKTLLSIEASIAQSHSCETKPETFNLKTEMNSKILSKSRGYSRNNSSNNNKMLGNDNVKFNCTKENNTDMRNCVSSRSLHSPFSNPLTLKPSLSEPEIKQSQILGMHSPNLSPSGSDAFLSPLVIDISPSDKIDWKTPVELNSDITVVRNLTPHNEAVTLSRKSFIWSTPSLPKENVSNEIII